MFAAGEDTVTGTDVVDAALPGWATTGPGVAVEVEVGAGLTGASLTF